jgi:uncharacterized protein (DUF1800 family)
MRGQISGRVAIACVLVGVGGSAFGAADPLAASANPQWSIEKAAHLLRRAGFGGTPEQIQLLSRMGRDAAVSLMIDYASTEQDDPAFPIENMPDRPPMRMFAVLSDEERKQMRQVFVRLGNGYHASMQDWWVHRMVATSRPLEEKMTLFWHSILTSGFREVHEPRAMYRQNAFLREHALDKFENILHGISRDRAMLAYLDGVKNVKQHPNENYARELMELFTLGVGNYSEQDVKEAARAFTGWACADDGAFYVRKREHDEGEKTFLGKQGNFDGDDVIKIILEQPAAPKHLAKRLLTFFAEPNPPDAVVNALAARLRASDYDLKGAMSALLKSDYFYSSRLRFSLIKGPAELVVGTARVLDMPIGDLRQANQQMAQMGQDLFQPPNVKGWDGGRAWINTSTLFIRYNMTQGLINGTRGQPVRDRFIERLSDRLAQIGIGSGSVKTMKVADLSSGKELADASDDKSMMMPAEMEEQVGGLAASVKKLPENAQEWLRNVQLPPRYTGVQPQYDPMPVIEKDRLETPEKVVDYYVRRVLQMDLPLDRKQTLIQALAASGGKFDSKDPATAQRVRSMLHLMMSMPEYQLN